MTINPSTDNVVINGNGKIISTSARGLNIEGTYSNNITNVTITNARFQISGGGYGVYSYYSDLVTVSGNSFDMRGGTSSTKYGIYAYSAWRQSYQSNIITRSLTYDYGYGIYTYYSGGTIGGNVITSMENGIMDQAGFRLENNVVNGTRGAYGYGIYAGSSSSILLNNRACRTGTGGYDDIYGSPCSIPNNGNACTTSNCAGFCSAGCT